MRELSDGRLREQFCSDIPLYKGDDLFLGGEGVLDFAFVHPGPDVFIHAVKDSIDAFEVTAKRNGMAVEVVNHENGYKYFDITEQPHPMWEYGVNKSFTADCDVIKEILFFLREKLAIEPISA